MSNGYIATFYSHFGAVSYYKTIKEQGINAKLMPVPRKISSSCGTCVFYEHPVVVDLAECEMDSIYLESGGVYACCFKVVDYEC